MNRAIIWFKTDLRLQDNETLMRAIEQSDEVIPVYCFDGNHFKMTKFGFKKTGTFRTQFLLESLIDLDENLRALGSGLIVVRGKPEEEITKLVKKYKVKKVFAKEEIANEELQTQFKVAHALLKENCHLKTFRTSTLYYEEDLPFEIENIPDVFTNFRKQVEKESKIRTVFLKPKAIKSPKIDAIDLPSLESLGLEKTTMDGRAVLNFKGGETKVWERLKHYFYDTKSLSNYKETRNCVCIT